MIQFVHLIQPKIRLTVVLLLGVGLSACQSLPDVPHTEDSDNLTELVQHLYSNSSTAAVSPQSQNSINLASPNDVHDMQATLTLDSPLAAALAQHNHTHPDNSGYYPILNGAEAFVLRSMFTGMASKSIDVQYYIWHNDETGQLLLKDLWLAAERGVIVRLLLDDFNNDAKLDEQLRRFASHPNIAVRLVNPLAHRKFQALNYLTDMRRINHRMHNKSMTFDRQASILGGRNVGDEYFSNSEGSQFADLDVLLIGQVIPDINASFEDYWRSDLSYDIETLVETLVNEKKVTPNTQQAVNTGQIARTSTAAGRAGTEATTGFLSRLDKLDPDNPTSLTSRLAENKDTYSNSISASLSHIKDMPFRWTDILFLTDNVVKLTNSAPPNSHLVHQLRTLLGKPTKQLTIISSYFVPTADGVDTLIALAEQGVEVKILTNSFKATDVTAVHSGYGEWRIAMLRSGIKLYELKAIASEDKRENKLWRARSQSSTSLHAKTFAIDSPEVFIGSYNVDPRSANINTEMGVLIDDDALAQQLHDAVTTDSLLDQAYEVLLTDTGTLQWRTLKEGQIVTYDKEPDVDLSDEIWMKFMSWLPIDWLL